MTETNQTREQYLEAQLFIALTHIYHQMGYLIQIKAGYNFESLGEDMENMISGLSPTNKIRLKQHRYR